MKLRKKKIRGHIMERRKEEVSAEKETKEGDGGREKRNEREEKKEEKGG